MPHNAILLTLSEKGQSESERVTDAFIIFTSIFIRKYPEKTQELLKYMSLVREKAVLHNNYSWRTYDEQFRLMQVRNPKSWDKMDTDLWLRVMPVQRVASAPVASTHAPAPVVREPICYDFNNGYCKWNPCRYLHNCSVCSSNSHAKWGCPMVNRAVPVSSPPNPANRQAFRGQQWRGKSFGSRGSRR